MADANWRFDDAKQHPATSPPNSGKRHRSEFEIPSGPGMSSLYAPEGNGAGFLDVQDTNSISASYDRNLPTSPMSPFVSEDVRFSNSGLGGHHVNDPSLMAMGGDQTVAARRQLSTAVVEQPVPLPPDASSYTHERNRAEFLVVHDTSSIGAAYDRYLQTLPMSPSVSKDVRFTSIELGGHHVKGSSLMATGADQTVAARRPSSIGGEGQSEIPLPPDARSTISVEGLPAYCSRREIAHIFRRFVGYRNVWFVIEESRDTWDDPLVLCFVDFMSPAHAATAMAALQGYKLDEHDRDSAPLRFQFARYPSARSGHEHRGKY